MLEFINYFTIFVVCTICVIILGNQFFARKKYCRRCLISESNTKNIIDENYDLDTDTCDLCHEYSYVYREKKK